MMRMRLQRRGQAGFTFVELMVGLTIGLFLVLIITQVMGTFESRGRATIGNADAQTNGGIALYTIGSDMQMAGHSLFSGSNAPLQCATTESTITGINGDLTPVAITDGAGGASDTITIRYGNSSRGGVFTRIAVAPVGPEDAVSVANNMVCDSVNQVALIVKGSACALARVTGPDTLGQPDDASGTPRDTTTLQLADNAHAVEGADITCLGAWHEITYSVSNDQLVRQDTWLTPGGDVQTSAVPILSGIVSLQAQYGIAATANSNQITQWVNASGTWATPEMTVADRNRIKAVRLAVIARNAKPDPAQVTAACSSTTAAAPTGLCAWAGTTASPAPAIAFTDANWQQYRYRSFETILPLRNVIWARGSL